jgi:succinoglycan biosynthesis transport protein ExoP
MTQSSSQERSPLRHSLVVLRRRKWVVALPIVLVTSGALLFSTLQDPVYEGTAELLIRPDVALSLTNTPDSSFQTDDPVRVIETQSRLAMVPAVAERAIRAQGLDGITPAEFLEDSKVSSNPDSDILHVTHTASTPERAAALATEHARQFAIYRQMLDTDSLRRARGELQERLSELRASGERGSGLYRRLATKDAELRTAESLKTPNVVLVRPAENASQVQPKILRNGVLALVVGLLLGVGLAFARDALDTRVRSAYEIAERLGLQLKARIAAPPPHLQRANRLLMLTEPDSPSAEDYRILRTNLELVDLNPAARVGPARRDRSHSGQVLMLTSGVREEGKSTTAANLAVALSRSDWRVVLLDLDLRRSTLHRFFGMKPSPGASDVISGRATLDQALTEIPVIPHDRDAAGASSRNGSMRDAGVLQFLPAGDPPPNAGEFVSSSGVGSLIAELRHRADIVLIDTPPLLAVGDAMTLSVHADMVLLITRLDVVRHRMLNELRRTLQASKAEPIGFVLAGSEREQGEEDDGYHVDYRRLTKEYVA